MSTERVTPPRSATMLGVVLLAAAVLLGFAFGVLVGWML